MAFPKQKRDALKAELDAIRSASGDGSLSPVAVLEWAKRHPKSLLYQSFEWDNTRAAHEYRLWQAREIIQEYRVEVTSPNRSGGSVLIPLVSVPNLRKSDEDDADDAGSYLPRPVVEKSADYRQSVLRERIKILKSMRETFGWLTELDKVWKAIDRIVDPS